jgi:tetratricopeptide (TPR) repeat protein
MRFDKLEINTPQPTVAKAGQAVSPEVKREEFDALYWMEAADKSRRDGLYETALKYYSRALEQDRSMVGGWVGQVQMLVLLEELPEADLWSRKALELFPNHGELLVGRGQARCRMNDLKQAYALCDGAFKQGGQSAYRWMVRGEILLATGKENYSYCFDKAHESDADWLVMLEIGSIFRYYRKPGMGLPWIRRAVEAAIESPYPWYVLGCCMAELGHDKQAAQAFRRCLDLDPQHLEAGQKLVELDRRRWSPIRFIRRLFRR